MKRFLNNRDGFSLVELLVVLLVMSILLYFAVPNIVQIKSDSETELAKARAEALNLAAAAYVQARGTNVLASWASWSEDQRFTNVMGYLAFPEPTLSAFLPSSDYSIEFNDSEPHKQKATLFGPNSNVIAY